MSSVPNKIAADLADTVFESIPKIATGEMSQAELDQNGREEWPLHYAVADALGGEVKPFDQYQGPYISVGGDFRSGDGPYALAPRIPGVVRLWIYSDNGAEGVVYNEDNEQTSAPFLMHSPTAAEDAVAAAEEVLASEPEEAAAAHEQNSVQPGPGTSRMSSLNNPLAGKSARMTKTADGSMLRRDDHPSANVKLQQMVGDPLDQPVNAFAQFHPNPGSAQLPNPMSPIDGDADFFTYMLSGAVFQAHDGSQWVIEAYERGSFGVTLYNRWYPRLEANVNLNDVRRSIHSWIEPVQVTVPAPPPGVDYDSQPVRIIR